MTIRCRDYLFIFGFDFQAVDELFKLMALFLMKHADATEQEIREINTFRRNTLSAYLQVNFTEVFCKDQF